MKALIICSIHALCDVSQLERNACNRACARHGIPAILSAQDHARILETTTMLDVLNTLPGSQDQRAGLIATYLNVLNDEIWNTSLKAHKSVVENLLDPQRYARPTGFVSDYPLLTTNLVRAAALLKNATKVGHLVTPSDPLNVPCVAKSLAAAAATLKISHHHVEVLVAHQRDDAAARSIGMHPRIVGEFRPMKATRKRHRKPHSPLQHLRPVGAATTMRQSRKDQSLSVKTG